VINPKEIKRAGRKSLMGNFTNQDRLPPLSLTIIILGFLLNISQLNER